MNRNLTMEERIEQQFTSVDIALIALNQELTDKDLEILELENK